MAIKNILTKLNYIIKDYVVYEYCFILKKNYHLVLINMIDHIEIENK